MSDHPNAIALDGGDPLTGDSHEIMRVWVTNGAGSSVWINAVALDDPAVFGVLMADTVRHAALAYASAWGRDEGAMLEAIVNGLSDELREQVNDVSTIDKGSLD